MDSLGENTQLPTYRSCHAFSPDFPMWLYFICICMWVLMYYLTKRCCNVYKPNYKSWLILSICSPTPSALVTLWCSFSLEWRNSILCASKSASPNARSFSYSSLPLRKNCSVVTFVHFSCILISHFNWNFVCWIEMGLCLHQTAVSFLFLVAQLTVEFGI